MTTVGVDSGFRRNDEMRAGLPRPQKKAAGTRRPPTYIQTKKSECISHGHQHRPARLGDRVVLHELLRIVVAVACRQCVDVLAGCGVDAAEVCDRSGEAAGGSEWDVVDLA